VLVFIELLEFLAKISFFKPEFRFLTQISIFTKKRFFLTKILFEFELLKKGMFCRREAADNVIINQIRKKCILAKNEFKQSWPTKLSYSDYSTGESSTDFNRKTKTKCKARNRNIRKRSCPDFYTKYCIVR